MQNSCGTTMDCSCCIIRVHTMATSFCQYDFYMVIIHVVIDGAGSIASSTDTGYKIIGIITANLFCKLFFQFLGNDALHLGNQVWVWMRSHSGTYYIKGVGWMAAPVTDSS